MVRILLMGLPANSRFHSSAIAREQLDVHLVVQEGIHLQHASRLHHAIAANALLQQFHSEPPWGIRVLFRYFPILRDCVPLGNGPRKRP